MQLQLINHSQDLSRLRSEGYEIEIIDGHLLVHHIPYVNNQRQIKIGVLVSELTLANNQTTSRPATHVIHFMGDHPCNKDGSVITGIINASNKQVISGNITIDHTFSNKPTEGYNDYYQKISTYANIISAPAKSLDKNQTEKTFRVRSETDKDEIFEYLDTNSSRAKIIQINAKLTGQKIGIIGLGGTGAYILDLVAKTPVKEIHLFDGDDFLQHNAFRSPGAASSKSLDTLQKKVNYYSEIYSRLHKGVIPHDGYVTKDNLSTLDQMSYVFISIDNGPDKGTIMQYLLKLGVPFIDVGLGVHIVDDSLIGTLRITTGSNEKSDHLGKRISLGEDGQNDYSTNIQIADLNCLNAALAVLKWKKMSGFYHDEINEYHSTYSINAGLLLNEDCGT